MPVQGPVLTRRMCERKYASIMERSVAEYGRIGSFYYKIKGRYNSALAFFCAAFLCFDC